MKYLFAHTPLSGRRRLTAITLMAVYLLIVLSPLAPVSLHSKTVAHAVTGECVGDCRICGCSPESRESRTCCCARKKQLERVAAADVRKSCCPPAAAASIPVERDCCSEKNRATATAHEHDDHAAEQGGSDRHGAVLKCGCPCGKPKQLALSGFGSTELLPVIVYERIRLHHHVTVFTDHSRTSASRHGEPPDPPPKLSCKA